LLHQHRQRLRALPFLLQIGGNLLQLFDGSPHVAVLRPPSRAREARFQIRAVQLPQPDPRFQFPATIAAGAAFLGHRLEIRAGVHQQPLTSGDLSQVPHGPFFVGLDLQDLSVQRDSLRKEPFVGQVIGDAGIFRHGFVRLAGAEIQVAKSVRRVPVRRLGLDHAAVFGDGQIELALPEQLLRFSQGSIAVKWHVVFS